MLNYLGDYLPGAKFLLRKKKRLIGYKWEESDCGKDPDQSQILLLICYHYNFLNYLISPLWGQFLVSLFFICPKVPGT